MLFFKVIHLVLETLDLSSDLVLDALVEVFFYLFHFAFPFIFIMSVCSLSWYREKQESFSTKLSVRSDSKFCHFLEFGLHRQLSLDFLRFVECISHDCNQDV